VKQHDTPSMTTQIKGSPNLADLPSSDDDGIDLRFSGSLPRVMWLFHFALDINT
jgi:hypothetical protein